MLKRLASLSKNAVKSTVYLPQYAVKRNLARRATAPKLTRVDDRRIPPGRGEIRLFMVARNESLRLPFVLQYYVERGVDRIFVLDNGSSDNTPSIVLSHDNAHLLHTMDNYANQATWVDLMLRSYGQGCWCIVVDADEILVYPHYETVTLRQLCHWLDCQDHDAMDCVLLDMYPGVPLNQVRYEVGTDPLSVAPWFDEPVLDDRRSVTYYFHEHNMRYKGPPRLTGGMRQRVFGVTPWISKFPLIKYRTSMYLCAGTHCVQGAHIADIRGALLHFKYLHDFAENALTEVQRGQRPYGSHLEYEGYLDTMTQYPQLDFLCPTSTKFAGSKQLVDLRIMKTSPTLIAMVNEREKSREYGEF